MGRPILHQIPIGSVFSRLTVIGPPVHGNGGRWLCRCACGTLKSVHGVNLRRGTVKSCGCLHVEQSAINATKHGHAKNTILAVGGSRTYHSWASMIQRCYNTKLPAYVRYGGRGITVCESWRESFQAFLDDMGDRPPGTSIDRIDNDARYCKSNCRWATVKQQLLNRPGCLRLHDVNDNPLSLQEMADWLAMNRSVLRRKLHEAIGV